MHLDALQVATVFCTRFENVHLYNILILHNITYMRSGFEFRQLSVQSASPYPVAKLKQVQVVMIGDSMRTQQFVNTNSYT